MDFAFIIPVQFQDHQDLVLQYKLDTVPISSQGSLLEGQNASRWEESQLFISVGEVRLELGGSDPHRKRLRAAR